MAETTADVRRDIEMTRERMSDTIAQLERKLNVMRIVREHPWPALAVAFGAGVALSATGADAKAAAASVAATRGASDRLAPLMDRSSAGVKSRLDRAASQLGDHLSRQLETTLDSLVAAALGRIDQWTAELKEAIGAGDGAPPTARAAAAATGGTAPSMTTPTATDAREPTWQGPTGERLESPRAD